MATTAHCVDMLQRHSTTSSLTALYCKKNAHTDKLLATMTSFHLQAPITDKDTMRLILDPSSVCYGYRQPYIKLAAVTRDYCFTLDDKCNTLLGYPSRFTMASCKNNFLQVGQ